jgi:hypothetical protein
MKKLLALGLLALSFSLPALADTIKLSDRDPGNKANLARDLISLLSDSGVALKKGANGVYTLKADKIRCDVSYNSAIEPTYPEAYLTKVDCRENAPELGTPMSGKPLTQAHALLDYFDSDNFQLGDCELGGRCHTYVKSISCSVDTKVEADTGKGRFECVLTL